jgi:alpha-N-arabinofuranosidase
MVAAAAFVVLTAGSGSARQPGIRNPEQLIYGDSLANGWTDVSRAGATFDTGSPVRSGTRSLGVRLDAFQLLHLRHETFDSSIYTSLTFWLHGGTAGGQRLRVIATLDFVPQRPVTIAPLAPNAWQQVTLALSSLGVAGKPNVTGIWIQEAAGTPQPIWYVDDINLTMLPPPAMTHLAVDAAAIVRTADARHFGMHTAMWDPIFDSEATVALLQDTGIQALRFPGGSAGNDYHWASNTSVPRGACSGAISQPTSFDMFARIAIRTGAQVFLIANYGSGTPSEAAEWVRYANLTQRYGFTYWEVGNENYGAWETDCTERPHDPFTYATRFKDYYLQMKAVDPAIKVGAVVQTGEDSYATYTDHPATNPRTGRRHNGWTPVLLATLNSLGVTPDFVAYHRYVQSPGAESDADLLHSSATWASDATDLRQQLTDYLGPAGESVELVCTEHNSVSSRPGKQTTSLVNGLFLADSIGQVLQTEFNSVIWHNLRQARESAHNNASWLSGWRPYGNYGITSVNFGNPTGPPDQYPTYYVSKLLRHFARGGDAIVRATSDYPLLAIYAARRTDGSLTLLVVNKNPVSPVNTLVALTGYAPDSYATVYSYGAREDDAVRTGAGSADPTPGALSDAAGTFTYTFPAYSATVIALRPRASPSADLSR